LLVQVRRAVQLDNYHQFFALHKETPNLGNCILDLMLDARRLHALQRVCKGYKPTVPLAFVVQMLDMDEEGAALLRKAGCVIEEVDGDADAGGGDGDGGPGVVINTQDSVGDMSAVFSNEKLLL
jgi:hypothetical protein